MPLLRCDPALRSGMKPRGAHNTHKLTHAPTNTIKPPLTIYTHTQMHTLTAIDLYIYLY